MNDPRRALVLGGGGVTGVAWELGVILGLQESGLDLGLADLVLGTSAGSVVGTRLRRGEAERAFAEQHQPPVDEIPASLGTMTLLKLGLMLARPGDQAAKYRKVGAAARAAHPEPPDARRAVIRSRIGDPPWPEHDLHVTAVDVDSGRFVVFTRDSGVTLLDAVIASCAVPLVWPPVPINGVTYVDGGIRSPANADLVTGFDRVLVLAPTTRAASLEHSLARQLRRLGAVRHLAITPDDDATSAMGSNSLDPTKRAVSADAGRRQGRDIAPQVLDLWR